MSIEQKVREIIERKGYRNRGCRFEVISEIYGIAPEEAKGIETITRTIRQLLPKDEIGEKLESKWHTPNYLFDLDNRTQESQKLIKDKLKYL